MSTCFFILRLKKSGSVLKNSSSRRLFLRNGMIAALHLTQCSQCLDQVLAQPSHALVRYRYRGLLVPRDDHRQAVVFSVGIELQPWHARKTRCRFAAVVELRSPPAQLAVGLERHIRPSCRNDGRKACPASRGSGGLTSRSLRITTRP